MYHCHTEYSLLDSCDKPQAYIDLAIRDGSKAISFSEHGRPTNWTEKWAACKKAGIRYIHSVEIYLTESLTPKIRDNYHTVLMAKNMEGLKELNRIVAMSTDDEHSYYTNRISFDEFLNLSNNIISTSACLASPLNKLPSDHPRYMELARKYDFLEIQGHDHPDQVAYNKRLFALSKEIGTPLIAGTDTHASSKYKSDCRKALMGSKRKSYGDEDAFDLSYKTYDELVQMFDRQGALPEEVYVQAIDNTNLLYEMTDDIELDLSIKYPILYGDRATDSVEFEKLIECKFQEKLAKGIIQKEQESVWRGAMDEELRVFKKLGMDGFMLSMADLTSWCKENGIPLGPARGSVGGSRVAYVTDITDLDAERWKTVFSRFCNEDREEIGDIDIDCTEEDRPAIFKHIIEAFGSDKTARVASFGTMQEKGVIDDVGRYLAIKWAEKHPDSKDENPWSLRNVEKIKNTFAENEERARMLYPDLFYYFDGLLGTKISQSIHPAGMVISPITLDDNYGVFTKDGELCLLLDMENIHDYTGLAKYDFLILKTVQVIRDTCRYIGIEYPQMYQIDFDDQDVWDDMAKSPSGIFQFEGKFAFDCLKKFHPKSIFDLAVCAAAIRPSGKSYRDELFAGMTHKNPSELIDKILEPNRGFLIFQEDIIAFLQQVCGLSGSEADNVRRAIGRKQKDRLDAALPSILNGYCSKSDKPAKEAEAEASEFLQIIEDASSYMFGRNHSVAYSLLGYLCAYYRYHYPGQFITAFLNNAANEDDIQSGTVCAAMKGYKITMPKWGLSRAKYFFNDKEKVISKGLASIKFMSEAISEELYNAALFGKYESFTDVLFALKDTSINSRQLDILIRIDYFSAFGNQNELLKIVELYDGLFKKGSVKLISKSKVASSFVEDIVSRYSDSSSKSGKELKNYKITNIKAVLYETEKAIKAMGLKDIDASTRAKNFLEVAGYAGYVSDQEEDRSSLLITGCFPVCRKKDGKQFGYSVTTKSIGSGREARFTIFNKVYQKEPINRGDIVKCLGYEVNGKYFTMTKYTKI